ACHEAATDFSTDPTGGTSVTLTDDSFAQVFLSGTNQVSIYTNRSETFFIDSNGYLTLGQGDIAYIESPSAHFTLPRISALFDDLNPAAGGTISWKQLSNRVAVTWLNVPEYGSTNHNSFQIELFFDGVLRVTWLRIDALDGLAGL